MLGRTMRPFDFGMWGLGGFMGWQWRTTALGRCGSEVSPWACFECRCRDWPPQGPGRLSTCMH